MLYNYTVPVPPFTYDHLLANLGKMRNHGLEIGFGITPLRLQIQTAGHHDAGERRLRSQDL
jgi:hypothetical protein